jgi:hypothetical protein
MTQHKLTMYETAVYRLRFQGVFDETWLQELGPDWTVQFNDENTQATMTITGAICDQAALIGLLTTLYNAGLPLLSVDCLMEPEQATQQE